MLLPHSEVEVTVCPPPRPPSPANCTAAAQECTLEQHSVCQTRQVERTVVEDEAECREEKVKLCTGKARCQLVPRKRCKIVSRPRTRHRPVTECRLEGVKVCRPSPCPTTAPPQPCTQQRRAVRDDTSIIIYTF